MKDKKLQVRRIRNVSEGPTYRPEHLRVPREGKDEALWVAETLKRLPVVSTAVRITLARNRVCPECGCDLRIVSTKRNGNLKKSVLRCVSKACNFQSTATATDKHQKARS